MFNNQPMYESRPAWMFRNQIAGYYERFTTKTTKLDVLTVKVNC